MSLRAEDARPQDALLALAAHAGSTRPESGFSRNSGNLDNGHNHASVHGIAELIDWGCRLLGNCVYEVMRRSKDTIVALEQSIVRYVSCTSIMFLIIRTLFHLNIFFLSFF
jgi:hypothetical protein